MAPSHKIAGSPRGGSRRKHFSTKSVTARLAGLLKIRPGGSRELRAQKSEPGGNEDLANLGQVSGCFGHSQPFSPADGHCGGQSSTSKMAAVSHTFRQRIAEELQQQPKIRPGDPAVDESQTVIGEVDGAGPFISREAGIYKS